MRMTPAEKQRAYRERQRAKFNELGNVTVTNGQVSLKGNVTELVCQVNDLLFQNEFLRREVIFHCNRANEYMKRLQVSSVEPCCGSARNATKND